MKISNISVLTVSNTNNIFPNIAVASTGDIQEGHITGNQSKHFPRFLSILDKKVLGLLIEGLDA